jgi:hypothetical protein
MGYAVAARVSGCAAPWPQSSARSSLERRTMLLAGALTAPPVVTYATHALGFDPEPRA